MSATEQRQHRILAIVEELQRVGVNDLADKLGVSKETIRRDLAALDWRGLLQKTHGGAAYVHSAAEAAFRQRSQQQMKEKQTIARLVNALLQSGESVMMNAGTTAYAIANAISGRDDLTVITNSLDIGSRLLHGHGGNSIVVLGGNLGQDSQTFGEMTIEEIRRFRVDHAILTIRAMNTESIFIDFSVDIASVARAMIRQASNVTIAADTTKLGRTALVEVCKISEIGRLVTDSEPPGAVLKALNGAGVEVVFPGK